MKRSHLMYLLAVTILVGSEVRGQRYRSSESGSRYESSGYGSSSSSSAGRFGEQYQVLLDRNIFSKYRTGSSSSSSRSYRDRSDYSSRYSNRQQYVLTGIVKEDGAYRAFIEDTRAGATTRYSVGQELGQGKITAIDVNTIKFGNGTDDQSIEVGMSLDGKVASFVYIPTTYPSVSSSGLPTTNPTDGSAVMGAAPTGAAPAGAAPAGPTNDIIERMKRARMQEIKQ